MTNLLFGFRGRITRAKFWLVALAIFVVELIFLPLWAAMLQCGRIRKQHSLRSDP
jgi:uncharacterized membrane protein YhaH (DUF805 family)